MGNILSLGDPAVASLFLLAAISGYVFLVLLIQQEFLAYYRSIPQPRVMRVQDYLYQEYAARLRVAQAEEVKRGAGALEELDFTGDRGNLIMI